MDLSRKKIVYTLIFLLLFFPRLSLANALYKVKEGETLKAIAKKFKVPVIKLWRVNNLENPDLIRPGQILIVPTSQTKTFKNKGQKQNTPIKNYKIGWVKGDDKNLRAGPGTNFPVVANLFKGTKLKIFDKKKDWYRVVCPNGKKGWVASFLVKLKRSKDKRDRKDVKTERKKVLSKREKLIQTALSYRGARYRWGGTNRRGFDCSGFVLTVYRKYGIKLPHSSKALYQKGKKVEKKNLLPGDLVFFHTTRPGISHVGIYIDQGKFIHASSRRRGRGVRIDSLQSGYYKRRYVGARRILLP